MQQTIYILQRFSVNNSDYADMLQAKLRISYPSSEVIQINSFAKLISKAKASTPQSSIFLLCPEHLSENDLLTWENLTSEKSIRYLTLHEYRQNLHLLGSETKCLKHDKYAYVDGYNYLISLKNWPSTTLLHKYTDWSIISQKLNALIKQTNKINFSVFINYPYSTSMNNELLQLCLNCQRIAQKCIYVPLVDTLEICQDLQVETATNMQSNVWLDYRFSEREKVSWQKYIQPTELNYIFIITNLYSMLNMNSPQQISKQAWQNFWQSLLEYCQANNYRLICQIANLNSLARTDCLKLCDELYLPDYLIANEEKYSFNSELYISYKKLITSSCHVISCKIPEFQLTNSPLESCA